MIKVTPQVDIIHSSGYVFKNRVIYDADQVTQPGSYLITIEDTLYVIAITDDWVVLPDNTILDERSPLAIYYDRLKQRDVDYIKIYKSRMGIHVFNSYAEEDFQRHRTGSTNKDVAFPSGHSLSERK